MPVESRPLKSHSFHQNLPGFFLIYRFSDLNIHVFGAKGLRGLAWMHDKSRPKTHLNEKKWHYLHSQVSSFLWIKFRVIKCFRLPNHRSWVNLQVSNIQNALFQVPFISLSDKIFKNRYILHASMPVRVRLGLG